MLPSSENIEFIQGGIFFYNGMLCQLGIRDVGSAAPYFGLMGKAFMLPLLARERYHY